MNELLNLNVSPFVDGKQMFSMKQEDKIKVPTSVGSTVIGNNKREQIFKIS